MTNSFEQQPIPEEAMENNAEKQEKALMEMMKKTHYEALRDLQPLNEYLEKKFGPVEYPEDDIIRYKEMARLLEKAGLNNTAIFFLQGAMEIAQECGDNEWAEDLKLNLAKLGK